MDRNNERYLSSPVIYGLAAKIFSLIVFHFLYYSNMLIQGTCGMMQARRCRCETEPNPFITEIISVLESELLQPVGQILNKQLCCVGGGTKFIINIYNRQFTTRQFVQQFTDIFTRCWSI